MGCADVIPFVICDCSLSAAARAKNSIVYAEVACIVCPSLICTMKIGRCFHVSELSTTTMLAEDTEVASCGLKTAGMFAIDLYEPSVYSRGVYDSIPFSS